jgi:hypothetical protein
MNDFMRQSLGPPRAGGRVQQQSSIRREFTIRLKRAVRRLAMIKKFANHNHIGFDSKSFEIAKLTGKPKNLHPATKKELLEKLSNYMDLECYFDPQLLENIKQ